MLPDIAFMKRIGATAVLLAFVLLGSLRDLVAQELKIGNIDFYGLDRVSVAEVRQNLTFKEGDTISFGERPAFLAESERRLSALKGVVGVRTRIVCCDKDQVTVYVGIEEEGRAVLHFREAPQGDVLLPGDIVQAADDLSSALIAAIRRGNAGEDDSQGHALADDSAARAIQERYIGHAARDLPLLRRVLRESSDGNQRALAAAVLGYAADKQAVVDDLVYAMSDPSEEVRNNAMRALFVFSGMRPTPQGLFHGYRMSLSSRC